MMERLDLLNKVLALEAGELLDSPYMFLNSSQFGVAVHEGST